MRKTKYILPLLLVGIVIAFSYSGRRAPTTVAKVITLPTSSASSGLTTNALQKKFASESQGTDDLEIQSCLSFWKNIKEWKSSDLSVPDNGNCEHVPATLSNFHGAYKNFCKDYYSNSHNDLLSKSCLSALFAYRIQSNYWATRDVPLSEISDMDVLNDRLFAEFYISPANATLVAKRMLELSPESEGASKMVLSTSVAEAYATHFPPGDSRWATLQELMEEVRANLPQNSNELREMEAIVSVYGAKTMFDAKEAAQRISSLSESPGLGFYYLAKRAADDGQYHLAAQFLREATKREPAQARYFDQLQRLTDPKTAGMGFPFALSLSGLSK